MGKLGGWATEAATGFPRACAVAAVTLLIPALWAGSVVLGASTPTSSSVRWSG